MKLILIKPRGFCAGVKRAIATVEKALNFFKGPIYVKHQIVHNKHVVEDLERKGAIFIEDISNLPPFSKIIYSAHGVSKEVKNQVLKQKLIEIDATCPLVTKIHSSIIRYSKKGYHIILIGHKNHIEVKSAASYAKDNTTIVENASDAEKLNFSKDKKLFYVSQTTFSLDDIDDIVKILKNKFPGIESGPMSSICYATTNRQNALKNTIDFVDLVLVVGDKSSSNSNRLLDVAKKRNIKSFLINDDADIKKSMFKDIGSIAITSGASTPEYVVENCIKKICKHEVCEIKEFLYKIEEKVFSLPKISN